MQAGSPSSPPAQPQPSNRAGEDLGFASFLNERGADAPVPPSPSPLLPPHAVVAAQMEALHRVDYPEADAGEWGHGQGRARTRGTT